MEFFEFILVLSITVILPLGIVKAIIDHKQRQMEFERDSAGSGVTAGELRSLLAEAVREANAPLLDRIDELEDRLISEPAQDLMRDVEGFESSQSSREKEEREADKSVGRRVSA